LVEQLVAPITTGGTVVVVVGGNVVVVVVVVEVVVVVVGATHASRVAVSLSDVSVNAAFVAVAVTVELFAAVPANVSTAPAANVYEVTVPATSISMEASTDEIVLSAVTVYEPS
jgi:hypothetical protein